jgi:hypothetical protein
MHSLLATDYKSGQQCAAGESMRVTEAWAVLKKCSWVVSSLVSELSTDVVSYRVRMVLLFVVALCCYFLLSSGLWLLGLFLSLLVPASAGHGGKVQDPVVMMWLVVVKLEHNMTILPKVTKGYHRIWSITSIMLLAESRVKSSGKVQGGTLQVQVALVSAH